MAEAGSIRIASPQAAVEERALEVVAAGTVLVAVQQAVPGHSRSVPAAGLSRPEAHTHAELSGLRKRQPVQRVELGTATEIEEAVEELRRW